MNARAAAAPLQGGRLAITLLLAGIVLASLTEAIAGTLLALGRGDIMGDTHATPDEFAWLEVGYTGFKLIGFMLSPWLLERFDPRHVLIGATLAMGLACGIAALGERLELLVVLRIVQGFAGGTLLVAGQAILFLAFPRARQPILQALFAMGSVVAPATLAPALQGWLIDSQSWAWIFSSVTPLALAAAGLILLADVPLGFSPRRRPFDWLGAALLATALLCLTYLLSQGSRWDWFEEVHIRWLAVFGVASLLAFLGQQALAGARGLLDFNLFRCSDFAFAFIVSFVAGAALFGSAFLIPAFALSVLAFTPTEAGLLLLPSGALFVAALLLAAFLFQARGVPPFATVPIGILMIMGAMWMLSGSTSESGAQDMLAPVLLRGAGLGFLFLSITLIAFGGLAPRRLAAGIGLFNTGRQLGGLLGVAALQTLIEHGVAANLAILGAGVTPGGHALIERLTGTSALLAGKGLGAEAAGRAATSLLARTLSGQSTVIAFDSAFMAVTLLFAIAAPLLVAIKSGLGRYAKSRSRHHGDVAAASAKGVTA